VRALSRSARSHWAIRLACVPDPDDGRRIRVYLTERARENEHDLIAAARAVNAAATTGLTEAEITSYQNLTARLIRNLEA
jgi:DNA-binding MarR family transcriptional regulator